MEYKKTRRFSGSLNHDGDRTFARVTSSLGQPLLGNKTPTPIRPTFSRLAYFLRTYIIRPLCIAGLFLMVGFAIFGKSFMFVPDTFLGGITEIVSSVLLAISLPLVANLIIHGNKSNAVTDIPTCQAVASAAEVLQMIKRYPHASGPVKLMFKNALLVHVKNAMMLLESNGPWEKGLLVYGENTDRRAADYQILEDAKNKLEPVGPEDADDAEDAKDSIASLQEVFERFETAKVDPTYRVPLSKNPLVSNILTISLSLISIALLAACVATLAKIFTGGVVVTSMAEAMSAAAVFGFFSWVAAKYVLANNSGGVYAYWAALLGVATVTFSTLGVFTLLGFDIGLSTLTLNVLVPILSFAFVVFAVLAVWYAKNTKKTEHREEKPYRYLAKFLTFIEISLVLGFLFLAFLSIATSFNLEGLGPFSQLMTYANSIILEKAGIGGYEMGTQWLDAFSIAVFAIPCFIAFELSKHLLEKSPASAKVDEPPAQNPLAADAPFDIQLAFYWTKLQRVASWLWRKFTVIAPGLFKLVFTGSIIIAVTHLASIGAFLPGATTSLIPIFLIIAMVMPLFAGNVNIPFAGRLNRWLNTKLGLKPFVDNQTRWNYLLKKEAVIFLILSIFMFFAFLPNVPTDTAALVLGLSGLTTLMFRWGTMTWNAYYNPKAQATDYMESSGVTVTDLPTLGDDIKAVQMCLDYFPGTPGHIQIRFKIFEANRLSRKRDLKNSYDFVFNWGSRSASYVQSNAGFIDPTCISIDTPRIDLSEGDNRKKFTAMHEHLCKRLKANGDPHTFNDQEYHLTDHNCAHATRDIAEKYLQIAAPPGSLTPIAPSSLPAVTFQHLADVIIKINKSSDWLSANRVIEALRADIIRLDLKILKAKATNANGIKILLEELRSRKEVALAALIEPTRESDSLALEAMTDEKASSGDERGMLSSPSLTSSPSGTWGEEEKSAFPRSMSSIRVPTSTGLQPEPKKSWAASLLKHGGWFFVFVVLLTLLVLMSTPAGQLLLGEGSGLLVIGILGSALGGLGLMGTVLWHRLKQPLYDTKERWELILKIGGLGMLTVLFIVISTLPATTIFSSAFLLTFMAITVALTSYSFGKQGLFPTSMESTWQLLGIKATEAEEGKEIIRIANKWANSAQALPAEKQLLCRFLDAAIQAMEHEILPNEKNNVQLTIWADEQEAGASAQFKNDLDTLKNFRSQIKENKAIPQPADDNDSITEVCERLTNCKMSADNNRTSKKVTIVLSALGFMGLAVMSSIFALGLGSSILSGAQLAGWVLGGLAIALLAIKIIMEWSRPSPSSYQECIGQTQPSSQKITAGQLIVWLSNAALLILTVVAGALLDKTTFLSMALVTAAWGAGQLVTSNMLRSWLQRRRGMHDRGAADEGLSGLGMRSLSLSVPAQALSSRATPSAGDPLLKSSTALSADPRFIGGKPPGSSTAAIVDDGKPPTPEERAAYDAARRAKHARREAEADARKAGKEFPGTASSTVALHDPSAAIDVGMPRVDSSWGNS